MKFKNLLYPVILAPAYIPELNIIQQTKDGKRLINLNGCCQLFDGKNCICQYNTFKYYRVRTV